MLAIRCFFLIMLMAADLYAGGRCHVFDELASTKYLSNGTLAKIVQGTCRGVCTEREAELVLAKASPVSTSGKGKFKGADAHDRENKQVLSIVHDMRLTKTQQRQLHNEITKQGLTRKEVIERARDMFEK